MSDVFGLSPDELEALTRGATIRSFAKNAVVVNEGDRTDSLYIILSGKVKVFVADEEGHEVTLGTQGAGEYFGEMVLDEGPRSASIMTLEPSRFALVSKEAFTAFLASQPDFMLRMIKKLIHRARALTGNVRSLALLDVYGRVARLLLDMSETVDGQKMVTKRLPKQDIAKMIGASREMVSRVMKDLQVGGFIEMRGSTILLRDNIVLPE